MLYKFTIKMKPQHKRIDDLYARSDELFLQFSAYFKKLLHDHRKDSNINIDQRKILKLFNFGHWQEFTQWVDEKLEEGGDLTEDHEHKALPEIIEEEADLQESLSEDVQADPSVRCELLAIENAKLRKDNLLLQDRIESLQKELMSNSFVGRH